MQQTPQCPMHMAMEWANIGVQEGGGPFGAVIVDNDTGEIIAKAHNKVTLNNDPTAHAEIEAIRMACNELQTFALPNCTLFTSCEPCPMCLSAAYWARIKEIKYYHSRNDANQIGFDDAYIYSEVSKPLHERSIPIEHVTTKLHTQDAFVAWQNKKDRVNY